MNSTNNKNNNRKLVNQKIKVLFNHPDQIINNTNLKLFHHRI